MKQKPKDYEMYKTFDDMFDDLPDGAYFAAMEEHGFDTDYMVEVAEYEASLEAISNDSKPRSADTPDAQPGELSK